MTTSSQKYTSEVTEKVDKIISSIQSNSPSVRTSAVVRSSSPVVTKTETVIRSESPNLRTSVAYTSNSPVIARTESEVLRRSYSPTTYVSRAYSPTTYVSRTYSPTYTRTSNNAAYLRSSYAYTPATTAVNEIHRIDNTCKALIAENDLLKNQIYVQGDLIEENSRVTRDLTQVSLENELLRSENRKVSEYEHQVSSLLKQSQDISVQLGHTYREASSWKAKFEEAEVNGGRYRACYEAIINENERLKAEVLELRGVVVKESHFKSEISRLQIQNEELVALKLRLSQELVSFSEENVSLRGNLKEIDVLTSRLSLYEQENSRLRESISLYSNTTLELTSITNERDVLLSKLTIFEREIANLRLIVSGHAESTVELRNTIKHLEGANAKLTIVEEENRRYREVIVSHNETVVELRRRIEELNIQISSHKSELSFIASLEEKLSISARSQESLVRMISEKERLIVELNKTISGFEIEISGYKKEISHLNITVEQSAAYRNEIGRLIMECEGFKLKIAKLLEEEQRLLIVQRENESLSLSLSGKLETIRELTLRISSLEEQLTALEQLKSKVVLVVAENERLNQSLGDQARIVLEWSEKYYNLEKLYLTIKETTEQLEVVKSKFERAVKETEISSQNLRSSTLKVSVKGGMYESRFSNSEAKTAGTPSDLLTSAVIKSYSRAASPVRFEVL